MGEARTQFQNKMDGIKQYMRLRKVNKEVTDYKNILSLNWTLKMAVFDLLKKLSDVNHKMILSLILKKVRFGSLKKTAENIWGSVITNIERWTMMRVFIWSELNHINPNESKFSAWNASYELVRLFVGA